jgi:hypothetical protein
MRILAFDRIVPFVIVVVAPRFVFVVVVVARVISRVTVGRRRVTPRALGGRWFVPLTLIRSVGRSMSRCRDRDRCGVPRTYLVV